MDAGAGEQVVEPGTGGVDHAWGGEIKGSAVQQVGGPDARDPVVPHRDGVGAEVIAERGALFAGGQQVFEHESFGLDRQRVIPDGPAARSPHPQAGQRGGQGRRPHRPSAWQVMGGGQPEVAVGADQVVEHRGDAHDGAGPQAVPIGRDQAGEGLGQVRGAAHQAAAREDRLAHAPDVAVLQVAQAAVKDFQAVGGGG